MQVLRFATRAHIEAIFEENHELWGAPFTPEQYRDHWYSLFLTPWGSSNFRYMALTEEEDGPLLSSLKLYRFTGRLFGEPVIIAAIGAVYTRKQRTYGSLRCSERGARLHAEARRTLLLFSTSTALRRRPGFFALPAHENVGGSANGLVRSPRQVAGS